MNQHDLLIVTAPFCQPNTPYPASAFLKGYLNEKGYHTQHLDLSIEVLDKILNPLFLQTIIDKIPEEDAVFYLNRNKYLQLVNPVKSFLQGDNDGFAYRINLGALPKGSRADQLEENIEVFSEETIYDQAKYRATVFIEEIIDLIVKYEDSRFGFSRYAERISSFSAPFDQIETELSNPTLVTDLFEETLDTHIRDINPKAIAFSIPFPGNLISSLYCCRYIKTKYPKIKLIMGGGFVNTELRSIKEKRLFNYIDFLTLDDGEKPLEHLLYNLRSEDQKPWVRTFLMENNEIVYHDNSQDYPLSHEDIGTPDYTDLPWNKYMGMVEMTNPMHRLWTEGKWVKMMIAHGCYWHKCSFCDTTLDYIRRYSQATAKTICDRIEKVITQTSIRSFHFIDEAAPPKILLELSLEIIRRGLQISWWTNVRFEKAFTPSMSRILSKAGCIGVSGGLEVASDRLLKMMNKGVSLEQVAKVTKGMKQAGILVHAYLMYGFPTETEQETIDALEVVRQLFEQRCIDSGFWHQFAMTVHSPVGKNPEAFGVERVDISDKKFAENDCHHNDPQGASHSIFSDGLKRSLFNYMHQVGIDFPLNQWFDHKTPKPSIPSNFISNALMQEVILEDHPRAKLWINPDFDMVLTRNKKKGLLTIQSDHGIAQVKVENQIIKIIEDILTLPQIRQVPVLLKEIEENLHIDMGSLFINKVWPYLKVSGWEIIK
ncbi:radical SAM protein [Halosquirtibacter laminarini]|uniref:Radical SAM protein n=1 Tax=Halosquirtibacter laminarini TaxID=3374600 RepID=A0AC61NFS8_9BACT|nr:radical SAM protein [Prolixibacteraceae bacterium]